jgi:uncharacterized protein (TIGR03437 family)
MRRLGLLLLLLCVCGFARHDAPGCGTTRETSSEPIFLHRQALRARRARPAALAVTNPPNDRDIGNIAIIEDSGGVVERLNQFNLDGSSVTFTPTAADASRYRYAIGTQAYESAAAAQGSPLIALDDDDSREFTLPFAFPFFGATYRKVWLNSDGNLNFNAAENSSSARLTGRVTGGPPRIAGLFDDLDPTRAAGGVRMFADGTHVVFSWVAVPEWQQFGSTAAQTFQIKLYPDGRIVLTYQGCNPAGAVVGIAPGAAKNGSSLVSFHNDTSGEYAGAVVERFGNSLEIDTVLVAQRFFQNHDDAYDYLVIYNNENINSMPGAVAYESTVRSSGSGWAVPAVDNGQQYGSPSRLRSVINMGQLTQYPKDPNGKVILRGSAEDTPLTVIGHEAGHLFLALASIRDPKNPAARPMLGFGGVHWSFLFNSEASLDEGEQITDLGDRQSPRFVTTAVTQGYSPMDQYLMGFRPPADVPDTFVVTDQTPAILPTFHPAKGISFDGARLNISADDVIRAEGRRIPDHTVAQRRFRFAFILVAPTGSPVSADDVQQVETYRQQFEAFYAKASGGNASAETTLNRSLKLSVFPAAGVLMGGMASATLSVQSPPKSDLFVQLTAASGFATVPTTVRIPAGSTSATFSISGAKRGVEELLASPMDPAYETAFARVQVSDATQAKLTTVSSTPDTLIVRLTDANDLPYPGARLVATASTGGSVIPAAAVSDESGTALFRWSPGPAASNELRVSADAAPSVAVTFTAGSAVPVITAVVNAASYAPGISAGSIGTAFGKNLANGKLMLNGVALTPLFTSDTQINFYVPAGTTAGPATLTLNNPAPVASFDVRVADVQPGIFGIVRRGQFVEIYCTGLGITAQQGDLALTVVTPKVFFGATPVQPSFSGLQPRFTGLYQVNAPIPAGLSGDVPIVISIGTAVSNEFRVTLP